MKAEGAIAKDATKLQPHGARMGSNQDPFDNVWYIASQVRRPEEQPKEAKRKTWAHQKCFA